MAIDPDHRALQVFEEAMRRRPEDRARYLGEACDGDLALRQRVESLLDLEQRSESFLECPALGSDFHIGNPVTNASIGSDRLDEEASTVNTSAAGSPPRLGDFEILRELGRGGMGIVYEARQLSLNRKVALKVMGTGLALTPTARTRFRREAEAAARLHHTNIVAVHFIGEHDHAPYYAMELVEGPSVNHVLDAMRGDRTSVDAEGLAIPAWVAETLSHRPGAPQHMTNTAATPSKSTVDEKSSSLLHSGKNYFDTVAAIIADVADALGYAHNQGVIHRDIKPSNLLLSPHGRLSINDFGLARLLEQPGMTMSGEFVGSPLYMSPEQIAAGRVPVDHRTDIYSLGATLYELLTLQPPFPGERRDAIIAQILYKEPTRPQRLNRKIPIDLQTICLKALEKDPARRYATAQHMAGDLRRFVSRHAIQARPVGPLGRAAKWARRRPAVAGLAACLIVAALAIGVVANRATQANTQLRQYAIDRAILKAFSGEYDVADEEIEKAKGFGAEPGDIHLLRGFLAQQRGQLPEALRELRQAIEYDDTNVAAWSLRATVCLDLGDLSQFLDALHTARDLPSRSFEDLLFKGMAESLWLPQEAVKTLDQAYQLKLFGNVPQVIQARARSFEALDQGLPALMEKAIESAHAGKTILSGNVFAISEHLMTQLKAAALYEHLNDQSARQTALEAADQDALELKDLADYGLKHRALAYYHEYHHRHDRALDEWRQQFEKMGPTPAAAMRYCIALYRNGDYGMALSVVREALRADQDDFPRVCEGFIALEVDGNEELNRIYRQHLVDSRYGIWLLRLAGRPEDEIVQAAEKLADQEEHPWRKYNRNELDDAELLAWDWPDGAFYKTGSNRFRCNAHFEIGLKYLWKDRERAMHHFRLADQTFALDTFQFWWARAFLHRLEHEADFGAPR